MKRTVSRSRSRGRMAVLSLAALCLFGLSSCENAGGAFEPDTSTFEAGVDTASCVHKDDGEACGTAMHCFSQRCVDDECGDGILSPGESCEDGNLAWGDGCDATCEFERPGCPDGQVAGDEECDDGNWNDNDECSNLCVIIPSQCGNGRVDPGEDCDDRNVIDDDLCSNECLVGAQWECRNGRLDPGEECDDGNTVDRGDGCTNTCNLTVCGNGKLEKYETCDDGDAQDGDACPSTCIETVCGNGMVESIGGEVCEGPRIVREGNVATRRGCRADCRQWVAGNEDACNKCQSEKCAAWMGIDLVGGCFAQINPEYGADPADPRFIQSCIDVVDCAFVHGCGFTAFEAAECYCGSNPIDACTTQGPAPDAPCKQEWLAAAKAASNDEVLNRFSDFAFASGWAYFLIGCYRSECGDVCIPAPRTMSGT